MLALNRFSVDGCSQSELSLARMLNIRVDHKFSFTYCCTLFLTHLSASMCQMDVLVQASCEMGKNCPCINNSRRSQQKKCTVCKPLVHTHMAKDQKTPKVEDRKEPLEISAVGTENARTT